MARLDLDTFLVLIEANRRYLSGYTGEDGQFDETAGALLITDKRCILATDSRYDLQAGQLLGQLGRIGHGGRTEHKCG